VLVVSVREPDPLAPLQGVPGLEVASEDSVGGGEERVEELDGPEEITGPPDEREEQPGSAGLPSFHGTGCRNAGAGSGRAACPTSWQPHDKKRGDEERSPAFFLLSVLRSLWCVSQFLGTGLVGG